MRNILLLFFLFCGALAPPPPRKITTEKPDDTLDPSINLPYERYLKEVFQELEKDPSFQKKLKELPEEDVKRGKIAEHIDELGIDVRTKLNDIKIKEINRLRETLTKMLEQQNAEQIDIEQHLQHLDTGSLERFNKQDMEKLIQKTVKDLEDLDKARREEFKRYEMKKEAMRQHEMAGMNGEQQLKQAEQQHEQIVAAHNKHPDINHPGGKEQLEEVWEQGDKMDGMDFDPKTFFMLHDLDGNGHWDEMELESLFNIELDKVYNRSNPTEDDMKERDEEMQRMREHVMNEMDKNKDKMISLEEFLADTQTQEFKDNEKWETLDQQQVYTDEELKAFEEQLAQEMGWGDNAYPRPPGHQQPDHMTPPQPVHQQQAQQQVQQQPHQVQQQASVEHQQALPKVDETFGV